MTTTEKAPTYGEVQRGKLWFERRNQVVTLGLTQAAVDSLGELESIELPEEGAEIAQGDVVATIEGSLGSLELRSPASGVVDEVNGTAAAEPAGVSEDPLDAGWLVQMTIEDPMELSSSAARPAEFEEIDADEDDEDLSSDEEE